MILSLTMLKFEEFNRDAKILIALNAIGQLFLQFSFFIMPFYLRALGYSMADMGAFFSLRTFVGGVFFLLAGQISLKIGYKKSLLLGALLGFLGRILQVTAFNYYLLAFGFFLVGVNMGVRQPNFSALLSEEVGDRLRHHAFSISFGLGTMFNALGVLLAGFMPNFLETTFGITNQLAYRLVLAFSFLQFIFTIPALLIINDVPVENPKIRWRRELIIKILKFSIPSAIIGLGAGITIPYMQLYFNVRFGTSLASIGSLFAIQQLVMGVGMFSMPIFAERYGSVKTIVGFNGTATGLIITLPFSPSFSIAALIYTIRTILMNIVNPLWDSFMLGFFKSEERATAIALRSFAWTVTFGVGNYIGGQIFEYSLSMPFFITGTLYALSMLSFWFFFRKYERG